MQALFFVWLYLFEDKKKAYKNKRKSTHQYYEIMANSENRTRTCDLQGMSLASFHLLHLANRNGRIRTSIAPQRVINCAALPIKLHSDN